VERNSSSQGRYVTELGQPITRLGNPSPAPGAASPKGEARNGTVPAIGRPRRFHAGARTRLQTQEQADFVGRKTSLVVRKTLRVEVDNFVVGEDASGVGTEF
jgi:hypothetical protein